VELVCTTWTLAKNPVFDVSTPLPGPIQTNNRAEIYAILMAVRNIEVAGLIDSLTDNKPALNTYNKGTKRARLANHADQWAEIFDILEAERANMNVYWMPSHTDTQKETLKKAPEWMK